VEKVAGPGGVETRHGRVIRRKGAVEARDDSPGVSLPAVEVKGAAWPIILFQRRNVDRKADLAPNFDPAGTLAEQVFQRGHAPAEKIANSLGVRLPKALWGRCRL